MQVNSEGVSASRVFLPADQSYLNLLHFFTEQFPHIAVKEWEDRFAQGLVLNDLGESLAANDAYLPNAHLIYFRRLAREPEIPFEEEILYQDEHILVADKPYICIKRCSIA
jgi:tRNA pseudouridine32 synthase/23S rRNA pseudouridine746 synthase